MSRVIALVDINNAFVSMARLFDPTLRGVPVVIAGNNDSIIVARSYEAKDLNIKMAQPYFQVKHLEQQGLVRRSANFALFTNISQRVRATMEDFSLSVIPYSIDENFCILNDKEKGSLEAYGQLMRKEILKRTGQPCGIGISSTRTLSKACNYCAKTYPATGGVVNIYRNDSKRRRMLNVVPVGEVWGCGKATTKKLNELGITTALQLADLKPEEAKSKFGINLSKTILELNGTEATEWDPDYSISQQIIASRSLGEKTDCKKSLLASIAAHVSRGSKKLRNQKAVAKSITVSIQTSPFIKNEPGYTKSETAKLDFATADNRELLRIATRIFESIYRPGFRYSKTGIQLSNIVPVSEQQIDLFFNTETENKKTSLMSTLDELNSRYGNGTVKMATETTTNDWKGKSESQPPNYTGSWEELAIVKA